MRQLLVLAMLVLSLSGCALSQPGIKPDVKPSIVVLYETVVLSIPEDILVVPDQVEPIDFSAAPSQKDVADWIARSEGRTKNLENKILEVKKIQKAQQLKALDNK